MLVYFLFSSVQRFTSLLILFDAGGLALFCITGTLKALAAGMNPVAAVLLGVTTAVGGGLLRDITANEVPQLFDPKDLYALPAFAGAALTVILSVTGTFNAVTRLRRGRPSSSPSGSRPGGATGTFRWRSAAGTGWAWTRAENDR